MTSIIWGIPVVNQSIIQYKISADMKSTLNFSMKQVYRNIKKCCGLGNQYIFVRLQIKYLSIAGLKLEILDEIGDFGRMKNDILCNIFLVSLGMTITYSAVSSPLLSVCRSKTLSCQ